jgi:hypothetical protein
MEEIKMFKFLKNLLSKKKAKPAPKEVEAVHSVSVITKHKPGVVKKVDPLLEVKKDVAKMVKYVYRSTKFPTDNLARHLLKNHMPNLKDDKIKPVYDELKATQDFLRILADIGNNNERMQKQIRNEVGPRLKEALIKLNDMVK